LKGPREADGAARPVLKLARPRARFPLLVLAAGLHLATPPARPGKVVLARLRGAHVCVCVCVCGGGVGGGGMGGSWPRGRSRAAGQDSHPDWVVAEPGSGGGEGGGGILGAAATKGPGQPCPTQSDLRASQDKASAGAEALAALRARLEAERATMEQRLADHPAASEGASWPSGPGHRGPFPPRPCPTSPCRAAC